MIVQQLGLEGRFKTVSTNLQALKQVKTLARQGEPVAIIIFDIAATEDPNERIAAFKELLRSKSALTLPKIVYRREVAP